MPSSGPVDAREFTADTSLGFHELAVFDLSVMARLTSLQFFQSSHNTIFRDGPFSNGSAVLRIVSKAQKKERPSSLVTSFKPPNEHLMTLQNPAPTPKRIAE